MHSPAGPASTFSHDTSSAACCSFYVSTPRTTKMREIYSNDSSHASNEQMPPFNVAIAITHAAGGPRLPRSRKETPRAGAPRLGARGPRLHPASSHTPTAQRVSVGG